MGIFQLLFSLVDPGIDVCLDKLYIKRHIDIVGRVVCKIAVHEIEYYTIVEILVFVFVKQIFVGLVIFAEFGFEKVAFIQVAYLHLYLHLNPIIHFGYASDFSRHHILDFEPYASESSLTTMPSGDAPIKL
jgi:hypothetical protein